MRIAHHTTAARLSIPVILVALIIAIPPSPASAQETPLVPGVSSVAVTDDAAALLTNPAALGRSVPAGGYFLWDHTDDDSLRVVTGLFGGRGFGLGYQAEQPRESTRLQRILIGTGGGGRGPVWIGVRTTYQWQRIETREAGWRWDIGLLCRPTSSLSIGFLAQDLNQEPFFTKVYKRTYTTGVAVRPLPADLRSRLSLYADLISPEEGTWKEQASIHSGFWSEIGKGVSLGAAVDGPIEHFSDDRRFSFGFRFDFLHASFSSALQLDQDDRLGRHVQALHFTPARQRTLVKSPTFARTAIGGRLGDEGESNLPLPLIGGPNGSSARPILRELETARKDPHVRGVLIELETVAAGALAEEIHDEIVRIRQAGKPVVAFSKDISGRSQILIASACDRVVLDEAGNAGLMGIRADIPYLGEMLDSLGFRFEKVAHGKYKTAGEQLILSEPSEGETEALNSVLDAINERQLRLIGEGRKIDRAKLEDLLSGKLWTAREALQAGLVDSLGDVRAARRILARLAGGRGEPQTVSARRWKYPDYEWAEGPKVAVVWLNGSIVNGKSSRGFLSGNTIGSETVVAQLRALEGRRDVKAVVLRIDSGGGDGLASDEIWRAVERLKHKGKKVVSSMSRVAGSGGYYIACNSDKIVAEPTTITGSIGVLALKPELTGFYDRRRIHMATFQRGDWMGLLSSNHRLTDEERAHLQGVIDDFYGKFLDRIVTGRGMSREAIDAVGQGRIWTGSQAKERGLIDELGGLKEAVDLARSLAGLPKDARVEEIHRPMSWFENMLAEEHVESVVRGGEERAAMRLLGTGVISDDTAAVSCSGIQDPLARWLFRSSIRRATVVGSDSPVRLENPVLEILAEEQ
jgi:protease IV